MSIRQGNKIRIAIFAGYYLPAVGGYIKNIHELAKRLAKDGYSVDVITCNTENASNVEAIDGVQIYRIPCWNLLKGNYPLPKLSLESIKMVFSILKNDYSIINTQTRFFSICLLGWVVSKINRIPRVHHEHGSRHTVLENSCLTSLSKVYDHTLGALIVKTADVNLGVSTATVNFLEHLGAKNAILMYNGIDPDIFNLTFNQNEFKKDDVIITFIGRLVYAKGVQDLITIASHLPQNVQILIIGDGSYRTNLETLAHQFNGNRIKFLGTKNLHEISQILKCTDIFVNPSYSEGLPTAVMEAAAAGCAIVATNVGGTSELIRDNENGYLVEAGNLVDLEGKIKRLIDDADIRRKFGKLSQEFIRSRFSWDVIIKKWEGVIETHTSNK